MVRRVTGYGRGAAAVDLAPVPEKSNGTPTGSTAYDFGQLIRNTATGVWYIYSGGTTYDAIGGGSGQVSTISGNTGTATPAAGNIAVVGSGSITTAASGSTDTISLTGLTNHSVLVGAGTATITKVAPSETSGLALVSQGSSADPIFGVVSVAGGGTGAATLTGIVTGNGTSAMTANAVTEHGVLIGGASNAASSLAVAATGTVLAGVSASDPAFTATPSVTSLTATTVYASGDLGGVAAQTALTNANSTTISTGVGDIKMSSGNSATNTAWVKIYVGTSQYWIPAWDSNSP